jgi:hypothetical protein
VKITSLALVAVLAAGCGGAAQSSSTAASTLPDTQPTTNRTDAIVQGQITSNGSPVPHAIIVVDYKHADVGAIADAKGSFRVEGAPTGHADVFTFGDGYIYDHGGYPLLRAGVNDHSRKLVHVGKMPNQPTVSGITWPTALVKPGGSVSVTATWTAHDSSGLSDEIFVFVPEFVHPALFGVGVLHKHSANGRYTAVLQVPAGAKPGKYTAYIVGAQESCLVNYGWPTHTIVVAP